MTTMKISTLQQNFRTVQKVAPQHTNEGAVTPFSLFGRICNPAAVSWEFAIPNLSAFARRAMLLLCMMVMCVGSAWGAVVEDSKVISPNNVATTTLSLEDIVTLFSIEKSDISFISWSVLDENGNPQEQENDHYSGEYTVWFLERGGNSIWPYNLSADKKLISTDQYIYANWSYLTAGITVHTPHSALLNTFKGYSIVCELSNVASKEITHRYTFLTANAADPFFPDPQAKSGASNLSEEIVLESDNISSNSISIDKNKLRNWPTGVAAKYVRWYVADADGEIVTEANNATAISGLTDFNLDADHGFIWFSPDGTTVKNSADLTIPTLTLPSDKKLENYRLVCRMSTDVGTNDGTKVTKEPAYDVEYAFSFDMPFKGKLVSGAREVEKTFMMPASKWSSLGDAFIWLDLANKQLKMVTGSDKTLVDGSSPVTLDDADFSYLWDSYTDYKLATGQKLYVRYVLINKSGVETEFPKQTIGSSSSASGVDLYYASKLKYGRAWSTMLGGTEKDLSKIMMVKIHKQGSFNWNDYDLVVYIATDEDGETTGTADGKNIVTKEPDNLVMKYTIKFSEPTFLADNINSIPKTIEKTAPYNPSTGEAKPKLFANLEEVATDIEMSAAELEKISSAGIPNAYARWYIVDGDGNIVSDIDDWTMAFGSGPTYRQKSGLGQYMQAGNVYQHNCTSYDPTVTMPTEGHDRIVDFKDYKIVCVVSNNTDYLKDGDDVVHEPTLKVKYVFSLVDEFLNKKKTTGKELASTIVLTSDNGYNETEKSITITGKSLLKKWPSDLTAKYIRWYVMKGDEVLSESKTYLTTNTYSGATTDAVGSHGQYWHSGTGVLADNFNVPKLDLPDDADMTDYKLVAVLSSDEGKLDGTTLVQEPAYDYVYTIYFEDLFKGELVSDAGAKVDKTLTLSLEQWVALDEGALKFDLANKKITLSKAGSVLASADLDETEYTYLWNTYGTTYTRGSNNFYVRYVLTNKASGEETYFTDQTLSDGETALQFPVKEKFGRVWTNQLATETDMSKIMSLTLKHDPTTFNWYDYDLDVYIGIKGDEKVNDGVVTMEPSELKMKYSIHFETNFPADNINASGLKTVYKDALYDKTTGEITPVLFGTYHEVLTDVVKTANQFSTSSYARWYVVEKSTNEIVSDLDSWEFSATKEYTKKPRYGYYITDIELNDADKSQYDPTFILPESYGWSSDAYKNYNLVCVVTSDLTGASLPDAEPRTMQVKYVYSLILTDEEYADQPFVHARGASEDAFSTTGSTPHKQWIWEDGEKKLVDGDHRQQVHQWDYDVYLSPGEARDLILPFQWYTGTGEKLEPRGYFRWYDWDTDDLPENGQFFEKGSMLNPIIDEIEGKSYNRGLFAWNIPANPCQSNIGVKFKAPNSDDFDEITIVCDVSKYIDGLDPTGKYLVHEPTLSTRYFFHIHPAKEIAKDIYDNGKALMNLNDGTTKYAELDGDGKKALWNTVEDNGRVVMSLNGTAGTFSLRFTEHNLKNYFLDKSMGSGTDLDQVAETAKPQWYAYYDKDGKLYKKSLGDGEGRFKELKLSSFNGPYTDVDTGESLADFTAETGMKFHVVGGMTSWVTSTKEVFFPVVHDEMVFVDAPPIAITSTSFPEYRTEDYMTNPEHMTLGGRVDFDLFPEAERYTEPMNSEENIMSHPVEWSQAQYGFCYPQLYDLNTAAEYNNSSMHMNLSPIHGDYIIMKSANRANVSQRDQADYTYQYHHWYGDKELLDISHYKNANDFGSFLYIDASDEARTIATFEFPGKLCSGSEVYFTAWVANFTEGSTPPQLKARVYGVDGSDRQLLLSFLTGDISTTGADKMGVWYQVYGHASMPEGVNADNYDRFEVQVDNYAPNTDGADYCVDEISVYTSTAKVMATQTSDLCGDDMTITIRANAENLRNTIGANTGTKSIYYRLFEYFEETPGNPHHVSEPEAVVGTGVYPGVNAGYGVVNFDTNLDLSTVTAKQSDIKTSGFYVEGGTVYFQLDEREFQLDPYKTYFVSVYSLSADHPGDTKNGSEFEDGWGNPYAGHECSVYSNNIVPFKMIIGLKEGGKENRGNVSIGCGSGASAEKTFDLALKYPDGKGGYIDYGGYKFDFFLGAKSEMPTDLKYAIDHLRTVTTAAIANSSDLPAASGSYTDEDKTLIENNWDKLLLSASTQFNHEFTTEGKVSFTALPVDKKLTEKNVDICSPLEFSFEVDTKGGAPVLVVGFDDVNYADAPAKRGIRLGLEQLAKMRRSTDNYLLHIPIKSFTDKGNGTTSKLYFSDGGSLLVSETNDPTVSTNTQLAKIVPTDDEDANAYVATNRMYLSLNLSGDNCKVDFHEGYYYEVSVQFYDASEASKLEAERCNGETYMVFKIVPEFVTWDSQPIGSIGANNANWNNDANWLRSERAELYKSEDNTQNTATDGHPNGYKNNVDIDEKLTTHNGYIPMKFTYVTMPTGNHAPDLNGLSYGSDGTLTTSEGNRQQGGNMIWINNTLITNTSPKTGNGSYPTDGIHYELLVRYGSDAEGEGCKGHRYLNSGVWTDGSTTGLPTKVFDCEKFDGNICREIYFKPGAELLQQQRLVYQKAWVEKELTANKWYLMSSPLKGTYAGDMYVPYANGRQETEAFQPITFTDVYSTSNTTGVYSRTKYPIYQRSWGMNNGDVYTRTDDIRATKYSANLKYSTVSSVQAEWGHTFNDVQVPYNTLGGFSIRAHKQDQADAALIRLPKSDTAYDYYEYNSETASSGGISQDVNKDDAVGQLVFDRTSDDQEKVELTLANAQSQGTDASGNTYYLVGNPFMGAIDMGLFFGQNTAFGNTYYTYEGSTLSTVDATAATSATNKHIIKPLQAFFVRCAAGSAPDKVVLSRDMMTDGNYETGTAYAARNGAPALTLTAENGQGRSTACVEIGDAEGSVETLFDSNLADVPMVYTVADGQAVSINQMPELDVVPFGVTCSSDQLVEVTLTGVDTVEGNLYVVDAVDGSVTTVAEGLTVSVQPNDYGRYFLTRSATLGDARSGLTDDIVVSVRKGELTVTSTARDLGHVRVMGVDGSAVQVADSCGPQVQFRLGQGIYVVETDGAAGHKTVKVMVR